MSKDHELNLRCACVDPFHFVHFCYSIGEKGLIDYFQIEFQIYQGRIWKRIRKAIEVIFSGWVKGEPDWSCIDRERIVELRDFCNQCLEASREVKGE